MARARVGKLPEFDHMHDTVMEHTEQVNLFDEANKVAIFSSAIGGRTYWLMRNLHVLSPENSSKK